MGKAFFVAGTDTEIGKTFTSCALLAAANEKGLRTLALKPVAAGSDEYPLDNGKVEQRNEDAVALMSHMSVKLPYSQVNPVLLKEPASPHIAAAMENKTPNTTRITGFCRGALMQKYDFALVEGAGGWRVPISSRETMADLARQLNFKVILVVGLRLGCLNHAMLTAEAIRRDGLEIAGWVANSLSPEPMGFESENIATLKSALKAPMLGHIPYSQSGRPEEVCKSVNLECLDL
jgi:dethiobiotin synthetase